MADFSDFQIKEYENISQAHFKTNEMVSAFFRYYIIVMAIPISSVGAAIFGKIDSLQDVSLLSGWSDFIVFFFCFILRPGPFNDGVYFWA